MTIREKMKNGMLYIDVGEGLEADRRRCQELLYDYNHTRPSEETKRKDILEELLGDIKEHIWIEPPFHVAYGSNIHIGDHFYANFNLVIIDDIDVYIGEHVMIAPNVTITPTGHPVDPTLRKPGTQFSIPVRIGNNVWIGSNAVILPGVAIGNDSVIGAGSVVTHDIPENVVALGNPCRILREINEHDKEFYYKDKRVK
jgi:galactoside O-acetyltransferase